MVVFIAADDGASENVVEPFSSSHARSCEIVWGVFGRRYKPNGLLFIEDLRAKRDHIASRFGRGSRDHLITQWLGDPLGTRDMANSNPFANGRLEFRRSPDHHRSTDAATTWDEEGHKENECSHSISVTPYHPQRQAEGERIEFHADALGEHCMNGSRIKRRRDLPCLSRIQEATSGLNLFSHPVLVVHSVLIRLLIAGLVFASSVPVQGQGGGQGGPTRADIEEAGAVELPSDPAAIIAMVGNSPILLGDMMPRVEARIKEVIEKSGQEIPEAQLKFARVNLLRGILAQAIQNKMMRESFLIDQVGTESADKRAEVDQRLGARARQMFFESEVPELKDQYKTQDLTELDDKLREKGSSLASRQNEFTDMMLGHLYIREKVDQKPSVSLAEVNEYYHSHKDEFGRPHRAKWEQMTVLFSRFESREAAEKAIWEMGREAYFGGSIQAVAKAKSQEPFASEGGLHDWTAKGSLASDKLDAEIFSIALNAMSEIIEDSEGLHIIRVLDRVEAGVTPLSEVQDEIRAKIRKEKIAKSQRALVESIQDKVPVWSMFPSDSPGAQTLPESISRYNRQSVSR